MIDAGLPVGASRFIHRNGCIPERLPGRAAVAEGGDFGVEADAYPADLGCGDAAIHAEGLDRVTSLDVSASRPCVIGLNGRERGQVESAATTQTRSRNRSGWILGSPDRGSSSCPNTRPAIALVLFSPSALIANLTHAVQGAHARPGSTRRARNRPGLVHPCPILSNWELPTLRLPGYRPGTALGTSPHADRYSDDDRHGRSRSVVTVHGDDIGN